MKQITGQKGMTLLETIFAIGFMITAVSAILALVISNISGQRESENQVLANNLAREGVEVVRNLRDTNWLIPQAWHTGLIDPLGVKNVATIELNQTDSSWQLNFDFSDDYLYLTDGVYSHNSSGLKTPYRRQLTIDQNCLDPTGVQTIKTFCLPGDKLIGLEVTSRVFWLEKGNQRQVTLKTLLYAWK